MTNADNILLSSRAQDSATSYSLSSLSLSACVLKAQTHLRHLLTRFAARRWEWEK